MNRRLTFLALGTGLLTAPAALLPAAAFAQTVSHPALDITVSLGRGKLITLPTVIKDVFVADDKIADVQVRSSRMLYVFGRAGGETTVYASNAAGQTIWSANVRVASNIDSIDQMLRMAMPDARITASTIGTNTVLLTGIVATPDDSAEAQRLVVAFMGKDANVITRLRTATPLQVNLQVRIAEVSRTLSRTIGTNLTSISNGGSGFQFGIGQGRTGFNTTFNTNQPLGVNGTVSTPVYAPGTAGTSAPIYQQPGSSVTGIATGTTLAAAGKLLGLNVLAALDLGEQVGLVTTLAQPNLTAMSGETADFLAGGEFPIPFSSGLGSTTVIFKNYGVSLSYTPTVLANGRISLRVRPEVSELTTQGAVQLNGYTIPGLTVRRAETTVELGSGQSFMIGGLLSNNANHTVQKLPGVGDLPVIGALFKSTNFQRGETELVIVVTPYLVEPSDASAIKLPTDGLQNPNDVQRVLGNMLSDGKSGASRPGPTAAPDVTNGAPRVGLVDQPPPAPAQSPAARAVSQALAESAATPKARPQRSADAAPIAKAAGSTKAAAGSQGAATPGFSLN